jgi:hypothetical protein
VSVSERSSITPSFWQYQESQPSGEHVEVPPVERYHSPAVSLRACCDGGVGEPEWKVGVADYELANPRQVTHRAVESEGSFGEILEKDVEASPVAQPGRL